jgi:hypothetical protein
MATLQEEAAELEQQVAKLSARDRRLYQQELARLGVEEAPEWLFSGEAALFSGAPEAAEDEDDDDTGKAKPRERERRSARSGGDGKGLTITDLPGGQCIVYVFPAGTDISTYDVFQDAIDEGNCLATGIPSSNGFRFITEDAEPWTGSGRLPVYLWLGLSGWRATVNFSNGSATVPFSSFREAM